MYKNWDEFLYKYDDLENDLGLIFNLDWQLAEFTDFVKDLKEHNDNLIIIGVICMNMLYNMEFYELVVTLKKYIRFS